MESVQIVIRVIERAKVDRIRIHQLLEVSSKDLAEVDGIVNEVTFGDYVEVDLNNCSILCVASLAYAEAEKR